MLTPQVHRAVASIQNSQRLLNRGQLRNAYLASRQAMQFSGMKCPLGSGHFICLTVSLFLTINNILFSYISREGILWSIFTGAPVLPRGSEVRFSANCSCLDYFWVNCMHGQLCNYSLQICHIHSTLPSCWYPCCHIIDPVHQMAAEEEETQERLNLHNSWLYLMHFHSHLFFIFVLVLCALRSQYEILLILSPVLCFLIIFMYFDCSCEGPVGESELLYWCLCVLLDFMFIYNPSCNSVPNKKIMRNDVHFWMPSVAWYCLILLKLCVLYISVHYFLL